MKYFSSDFHFSHKNIVKFTDRSVSTDAESHNEWLVSIWNRQVQKGDLVYHLGDFSFAKTYDIIADQVASLNGQKIFIKGNHDDRDVLDRLVKDKLVQAWYDYKEIKIGSNSVVLFHFPIASWHKQGYGSWHLHGHTHSNLKEEFSKGRILDVGIDNAYKLYGEHFLFSESDVEYHMQEIPAFISDKHRENI